MSDIGKAKSQTNADRIRNMSDEELLDFICSIETYDEGSVKTIENGVSMHTVTEVRVWLQSEAEQERIWKIDIYSRQKPAMGNG